MKWYENGIMFEGTPEEFRVLHPEIAGTAPVSTISVFPDTEDAPEATDVQSAPERKQRGGQPRLHIIAELADGALKSFRSGKAAYRWYAEADPVRKITHYLKFIKAVRSPEGVRFADVTMKVL